MRTSPHRIQVRTRIAGADAGRRRRAARSWRPRRPPLPTAAASVPGEKTSPNAEPREDPVDPIVPQPRRTRRLLRWALGGTGAVLGVALCYTAWVLSAFASFENRIYQPRPSPAATTVAVAPAQEAPTPLGNRPSSSGAGLAATATPDDLSGLTAGRINILVLGTDKRENDPEHYARSDSMILVNLDTVERKARLLSLPRDLVVQVPGYGANKINAAYMLGEYYKEPGGGQTLAAEAISQYFNVPIDYYVAINFEGFREVIDSLGGIDINVPYEIDDYHYPSDDEGDPFGELHLHFSAGWQHMNGKTALRYARTRHADNDFMRSKRQLDVILAARNAAFKVNVVPRVPSLIDKLGGLLQTDIPFDKQLSLTRFGAGLARSDIMTTSIGSDLIYAVTLPDGSEGLQLDWTAAEPTLTDFFGPSVAGAAMKGHSGPASPSRTPDVGSGKGLRTSQTSQTPTPLRSPGTKRATPTRTPVTPARTPGSGH